MSLLEWLFESVNPGPVGEVKMGGNDPDDGSKPPRRWLVYLATVLGLLLAAFIIYWIFQIQPAHKIEVLLVRLCLFAAYIVASHFIQSTPETSNMGWAGGLIDNPFRISDDFNRWLLIFSLVLLPGKLIAFALIMTWLLIRRFVKTWNR